jgi:hypothetical protein
MVNLCLIFSFNLPISSSLSPCSSHSQSLSLMDVTGIDVVSTFPSFQYAENSRRQYAHFSSVMWLMVNLFHLISSQPIMFYVSLRIVSSKVEMVNSALFFYFLVLMLSSFTVDSLIFLRIVKSFWSCFTINIFSNLNSFICFASLLLKVKYTF